MSMILKNEHSRLAFRFGRQSGIRASCETLEQLETQNARLQTELAAEHAQNVQLQQALDIASRQALQTRLEVAIMRRDAALAAAPSPSAMVH